MEHISDKATIYIVFALMFFAIPIKIAPKDENVEELQSFIDIMRKVNNDNKTTKIFPKISKHKTNVATQTDFLLKSSDKISKGYTEEKVSDGLTKYYLKSLSDIPQKWDWRDNCQFTKIRSQGACGSCYAQSVVATIETIISIEYNLSTPIELSVQQMIDCAGNSNYGCNGGDTCSLLKWLKTNKISILPETLYPPTQNVSKCKTEEILNKFQTNITTVQVADFICSNFTGKEYEIIRSIATYGPVTAAVNAALWKNYLGGVIQFHCNQTLNHAVEIIGYDLTAETPFYIVRNSWGSSFGLDGYAKVAIGSNVCGIASEVAIINAKWGFL